MVANTLLLRLEGPMQSWGVQESKFVVRRTAEAPTKSGVIGLLCAAMGVSREAARVEFPRLNTLRMGVRIDRPGVRWWDYHTVGAGMAMRTAEGKTKPGAILTRREYLCDASFLVALWGDAALVDELSRAVRSPKWTLYLGRKSCPPSVPLVGRRDEPDVGEHGDLVDALRSVTWRPRHGRDDVPPEATCLIEWVASATEPEAPDDAEVWYDVPTSFDPPAHRPRFVLRSVMTVGAGGKLTTGEAMQSTTPAPPRPRADYTNSEYRKVRQERLEYDHHLCVFCKSPATTVQHITYRRAGGEESVCDLRSLCRLCHDAVTMIEYGLGMGLDRINPEDPQYRNQILQKRDEIIRFRSLETRRRRLEAEEVE